MGSSEFSFHFSVPVVEAVLVSILDDYNRVVGIPRKAQRPSQTIPSSAPSELSTASMQKEME